MDDIKSAVLKSAPQNANQLGYHESFHRYNDINNFMDAKVHQYQSVPDIEVKSFDIGKSYQGRNIKGLLIRGGRKQERPGILWSAGMHARE